MISSNTREPRNVIFECVLLLNRRLNARNCGSALAIAFAIFYVICAAAVAVIPNVAMWVLASWFHGLNLAGLFEPGKTFEFGSVAAGFVTFTIFGWLAGAVFGALYNVLQGTTASRVGQQP